MKTASFVLNKYVKIEDALSLKWLPIKIGLEGSTLIFVRKSLYDHQFLKYLHLLEREINKRIPQRNNNVSLFDIN